MGCFISLGTCNKITIHLFKELKKKAITITIKKRKKEKELTFSVLVQDFSEFPFCI